MSNPLETVRQNVAVQNVISPVGAPQVAERTGSFRTENVKNSKENSKVSDAAKTREPTSAKENFKSLSTRALRQGQASTPAGTARIADYYDKLPNFPDSAKVQSLVDSFQSLAEISVHSNIAVLHKANQGNKEDLNDKSTRRDPDVRETEDGPTPEQGGKQAIKEQITKLLQSFDKDVTHQYAALEIIRDQFGTREASTDFLAALEEIKASFETSDVARDVRAGFASAEIASRLAATLETDPATIREAYRSMLREQPNLGILFDQMAKFNISGKLEETIGTFMEAASTDLRSTGPSTDDRFLHGLLTELGKLKKIRTTLDGARSLIATTERMLPREERGRLNAVETTGAMLTFCGKATTSVADARRLLGPLDAATPASKVVFANGLKSLHDDIPDEVMPSIQARQQQVTTLALFRDQLVMQEEEHYERGAP